MRQSQVEEFDQGLELNSRERLEEHCITLSIKHIMSMINVSYQQEMCYCLSNQSDLIFTQRTMKQKQSHVFTLKCSCGSVVRALH